MHMRMKFMGFKDVIYLSGVLVIIAVQLSGCTLSSRLPNKEINYLNRNVYEVSKELEGHGLTCFRSDLTITRISDNSPVIDSDMKKLSCYIVERKWICPIKHSIEMNYSVYTNNVVSRALLSEAKQCF